MIEKVVEKNPNVLMREENHVTATETADAVMNSSINSHPHHPTDNVIATKEVMNKKEGHWMYDDIRKEREKGLKIYIILCLKVATLKQLV